MAVSPDPSPTRIELLCAQKGLRLTGQRRVIAKVLSAARDHPDVEEVHRRSSSVDARISLSTVYRTIKLFAANGFLERHNFGAGRGRYEETARRHHDHLIDIESGEVIEFRNEEIEQIQERVARELGFSLVNLTTCGGGRGNNQYVFVRAPRSEAVFQPRVSQHPEGRAAIRRAS